MNILRTKSNIPRIFLEHYNAEHYNAVNMIHDVIRTANPFPYTAKFMFVRVRNNKTQQVRC